MEDGGRKVFAFLKRKQSGCEVVSMGLPQSVGSEQDRKIFDQCSSMALAQQHGAAELPEKPPLLPC